MMCLLSLEVCLLCICRKGGKKEAMRGRVGAEGRANLSNEINSMLINDCSFILSYLKEVASRNILGL